jgi:DNA-3-methyladenine glycosylase II
MDYVAATQHLQKADPVLRALIVRLGPCRMDEECDRHQFGVLVTAILHQQLAYAAARTITRNFKKVFATRKRPQGRLPKPQELLAAPRAKLRAAGVSKQKLGYLWDLAQKASDGTIRLGRFSRMSDEQVIENLILVKGIGRWTAEMFLMFCLERPDVLPVDDLGLQYGVKSAYSLRTLPAAGKMLTLAEPWRPFRSVGTWYMWKLRRVSLEEKSRSKKRSATN